MYLPTDIANLALDAAAVDFTLGDIEDGTKPAQVCLRAYRHCLMQLLRAAHWNFARREASLVLLGDATGGTPNVGTLVSNTQFIYAYQLPPDCMKVRFVPWNVNQNPGAPEGNIVPVNPAAPIMPGLGQPPLTGRRPHPAKFNVGMEYNYPPPPGQITWEVQGVSPQGRTAIFTNVKNAKAVYTSLVLYPSVWDPQFRAALVAYISSEIIMALHKDKKMALGIRGQQVAIAKEKIAAARISDGDEGFFRNDNIPDWIKTRAAGTGGGYPGYPGWGSGSDGLWGSWDSCGFSDGTAY
jgi:hypothetical protein